MSTNDSAHLPLDFPEGKPIYDKYGERLGEVSTDGVIENSLMMTKGRLFKHDVAIPVSAIERSDADGIYLNRTQREIQDLTLGGWSSLGDVDLDSGETASGQVGAER